ncbi:hypothetical protein D3C87_2112070 [compost metagenome]
MKFSGEIVLAGGGVVENVDIRRYRCLFALTVVGKVLLCFYERLFDKVGTSISHK